MERNGVQKEIKSSEEVGARKTGTGTKKERRWVLRKARPVEHGVYRPT